MKIRVTFTPFGRHGLSTVFDLQMSTGGLGGRGVGGGGGEEGRVGGWKGAVNERKTSVYVEEGGGDR